MRRVGISTMFIWPALALALIGTLGSLILIQPHDFWWHMKIGEVIARTGDIPRSDSFSFTREGVAFVYQSWLSEWLLYQLYQLGQLGLIVAVRNLLLLLAYGLIIWQSYRRSGSWRLAAIAGLIAASTGFNNWSVRPQTFSWLPFALTWTILAGYTGGWLRARWLLALPAIELVWANLHGAFTLGLALAAVVAVGETIERIARSGTRWRLAIVGFRRPAQPAATAEQPSAPARPLRPLWLALAGMLLATLLNPRGPGLYQYVWTLLTDPSSQQLVVEWQPPRLGDPVALLFFVSLMGTLLLWLRMPGAGRLSDMLVLLAFAWLALGGVRYMLWFGMICGPLLASLIAGQGRRRLPARPEKPAQRRLNLLLVLALFLPMLALQPPWRAAFAPPAFRGIPEAGPEGGLLSSATPLRAASYLREQPAGRRMYHDMVYGSYLIWAFGGELPVFADPRVELYPLPFWQDYRRIAQGCDYAALLDKYAVDSLLLSKGSQARLIERLRGDARWQQVYEDDASLIYRRSEPVGAEHLERGDTQAPEGTERRHEDRLNGAATFAATEHVAAPAEHAAPLQQSGLTGGGMPALPLQLSTPPLSCKAGCLRSGRGEGQQRAGVRASAPDGGCDGQEALL